MELKKWGKPKCKEGKVSSLYNTACAQTNCTCLHGPTLSFMHF